MLGDLNDFSDASWVSSADENDGLLHVGLQGGLRHEFVVLVQSYKARLVIKERTNDISIRHGAAQQTPQDLNPKTLDEKIDRLRLSQFLRLYMLCLELLIGAFISLEKLTF